MQHKTIKTDKIGELNLNITYSNSEQPSKTNHNEPHIHKECEIYINLSGDVSFEVENRIYAIKRGSVIITRPLEYHHCICHSEKCHEHYWITFCANPGEEFLDMFFSREKGERNLILLNEENTEKICRVLEKLLKNDTNMLDSQILTLSIFSILKQGIPIFSTDQTPDMPQDILAALNFMDNHITESINVKSIAFATNQSVNTLERHFKAALNITPVKMLTKKRLILSLNHLRCGNSVTEAAIKSGFEDYSNYIQLFKKQFGITPLQYKNQFK